jgi:uncharacterized membrane protein
MPMRPSSAAEDDRNVPVSHLKLIIMIVIIIGYAVASHYAHSNPDAKGLGAGLSIGPIVLIGTIAAWRLAHMMVALLFATLSCALLYAFWQIIENNYVWTDLVQQCGAYSLISLGFARSLLAGRTPVCTFLATKIHAALEPIEISYTRKATLAWAVFYLLIALCIPLVFFLASPSTWSVFIDFVIFGLIIAMGAVDYAVRRRFLPRRADGGILGIIRQSLIG